MMGSTIVASHSYGSALPSWLLTQTTESDRVNFLNDQSLVRKFNARAVNGPLSEKAGIQRLRAPKFLVVCAM